MALGTEMIGIRVTREMKAAIEDAAKRSGQTVSDYLRNVVEGAISGAQNGGEGDGAAGEVRELRRLFFLLNL